MKKGIGGVMRGLGTNNFTCKGLIISTNDLKRGAEESRNEDIEI